MQITVLQDKNNNCLNGCLPWWALSGSIVQTYINLFLQSYKHSSWHMVCDRKTGPATLPNSVIVLQLHVRDRKMWVVSLSVCVCVQTAVQRVLWLQSTRLYLEPKDAFLRVLNITTWDRKKEWGEERWLQARGRQTLEYRLECQVCERSIGPSVYAC